MVRQQLSRRSVLTTAAAVPAALAGCLQEGHCETVIDRTERVDRNSIRVYDTAAEAGHRLYIRFERIDGPAARLSVFDPTETPILQLQGVDRLERRLDITDPGRYSVVVGNDSTADHARWRMTVVVYQGWCPDVF